MRYAAHPLAPEDLKADARTVLKWLGVDNPQAIETKHHDVFVRAVERYIVEGQAPSGALAPTFAAYSEWLTKIYATPQSLNVPLDNDIRGVFSRLLAMPDQIADWTADRGRAAIAPEHPLDPLPAQKSPAGSTIRRFEKNVPEAIADNSPASLEGITNPFHRPTTTLLLFAMFSGIWVIDVTCMSLYWVARLSLGWDADRAHVATAPEHYSPGKRHVHEQTSNLGSQQRSIEQQQVPAAHSNIRPSPQSELVHWSEMIGRGATMKLRSGEICLVSVARSGVLVKATRGRFIGFFGTVLYNEKNAYKVVQTVMALDALFPVKIAAVTFRNPILTAYANAIWQCSTAAEVAITLNEAIARAGSARLK
jgi:hypothetical protein